METAELIGQTFEQRYYEIVRHQKLAPEIGRVALQGLERRRYEEITSGLAEALNGRVKTHYTFESIDGKIVAADGQELEELLINGLDEAKKMSAEDEDNFFADFLPQRAQHELYELRDNQAMALGRLDYNTQIKFSPMTEEKATSEQNKEKLIRAGQKPYFSRGMLRISHWDGQKLHMFTRSIDNSDVELFRQTAKVKFNYEFEAQDSTQMLGESIWLNIKEESWKDLADSTVATTDKILSQRFGDKRIQGRSEREAKDLQVFVESETQIVNSLFQIGSELAAQHPTFESYKQAFDDEIYNHIALLEKRLEIGKTEKISDVRAASGGAGAIARAEGKVYDMCGNVLGANNAVSQAAAQTGLESLARLANKEVQCPFCSEKVIVPKADLDKGKLYCKECDTGVDVCTGEKFSKGGRTNEAGKKMASFFEIISADLARIKRQEELKRIKKEEKAQLKKVA